MGQFIVVEENQTVPADMILIAAKDHGSVFLDMTRLTGISTMKEKKTIDAVARLVS